MASQLENDNNTDPFVDQVDSLEFDYVIQRLRGYCRSVGLVEACVQHRRSILAACEDPRTVSLFTHGGKTFPLPQTGQMQLELEMLRRPTEKGFFTLSYSYRNEPDPIPGRHDLIFPMFEFEIIHGGIEELIDFEAGLLQHLGFDIPDGRDLPVLDLNKPSHHALRGRWEDVAKFFGVNDIDHTVEQRIEETFGLVFFLTDFPNYTSPFWNMRQNEDNSGALKVDVILSGMETIGSAERACDKEGMRRRFREVSNGEYSKLLYTKFGKERVDSELEDYLSHKFIQRSGGGIGLTRLIRAMRKNELIPKHI